ncbi:MAG: hypothetical protein KJO18_07465 [Acidimicrobiia bacterium]|nr:hypothetical protein [Acidimicrobiia bacterium]
MSSDKAPTMIIPRGTDIEVDVHGQLTIRTPGNLVIQDSGNFATLESVNGSIRIESNAEVEAVTVRCAETCFIEGALTAWKVTADSIHLEDAAKANIVLQETQRLEVGQGARIVGNFKDEKELFYLFSRFAGELRALPIFSERKRMPGADGGDQPVADLPPSLLESLDENAEEVEVVQASEVDEVEVEEPASPSPRDGALPDPLFYSLVILEREFTRPAYGPTSQRAIEELVKLLRDRDFETLRLTYKTLFSRIVEPGKDVQRVQELIGKHFQGSSAGL